MSFLSQLKFEESELRPSAKILEMKKDARLTFRIRSSLKKDVEGIADREGHSVAQICEAFLTRGVRSLRETGQQICKTSAC